MHDNICHFVPYHKDYDSLHTTNFVFESHIQIYNKLKIESTYRIYLVCSGNGLFHTQGNIDILEKGDVFFTFPGHPFCIESKKDFTYMYISFLGTRGVMLLDKIGISNNNLVFRNCDELLDIWRSALNMNSTQTDLTSESVLLYSFAYIESRFSKIKEEFTNNSDTISKIKKFTDDNFSDPTLSLEKVSNELNYNHKYISTLFKRRLNVGFSQYLTTIRIQYACTLMQQGYTSVTDVASLCGFSNSQYFSKVFKAKTGLSPKAYMHTL